MILPFSTKLNGKETFFVEKILVSLIECSRTNNNELFLADIMRFMHRYCKFFNLNYAHFLSKIEEVKPKHHTMREDLKGRWNDDCLIHFFINTRTKLMFCFAPILRVVSTQKIEIKWHITENKKPEWYKNATICIDDVYLDALKVIELAQNDGFDTIEDFFAYFNKDFKGKLIHWTDLRY